MNIPEYTPIWNLYHFFYLFILDEALSIIITIKDNVKSFIF